MLFKIYVITNVTRKFGAGIYVWWEMSSGKMQKCSENDSKVY
jgi:hypothetical protein